jgi:hypothetical protein
VERARGFNRDAVKRFFDIPEAEFEKHTSNYNENWKQDTVYSVHSYENWAMLNKYMDCKNVLLFPLLSWVCL